MRIELRVEIEPALPPALVDRDLITRAIDNLIRNAVEAMPQGGVLTLGLAMSPAKDRAILLTVEDVGEGMDARTRERAFDDLKRGAADFALKPFDREELLFAVKKALSRARHAEAREPAGRLPASSLLGDSTLMRECRALIARAAAGSATVLVRGESGTGKELAAQAIHDESPRRAGPFVKIHCAALPDNLLESEPAPSSLPRTAALA